MYVAIRASFWVLTFGTLGYTLFKVVKPDDELLKKIDKDSANSDTRKFAKDTISVLKQAASQSGELNQKIEELLKKGK